MEEEYTVCKNKRIQDNQYMNIHPDRWHGNQYSDEYICVVPKRVENAKIGNLNYDEKWLYVEDCYAKNHPAYSTLSSFPLDSGNCAYSKDKIYDVVLNLDVTFASEILKMPNIEEFYKQIDYIYKNLKNLRHDASIRDLNLHVDLHEGQLVYTLTGRDRVHNTNFKATQSNVQGIVQAIINNINNNNTYTPYPSATRIPNAMTATKVGTPPLLTNKQKHINGILDTFITTPRDVSLNLLQYNRSIFFGLVKFVLNDSGGYDVSDTRGHIFLTDISMKIVPHNDSENIDIEIDFVEKKTKNRYTRTISNVNQMSLSKNLYIVVETNASSYNPSESYQIVAHRFVQPKQVGGAKHRLAINNVSILGKKLYVKHKGKFMTVKQLEKTASKKVKQ